ncbi:MAG: hypothetical protein AB1512_21445 [Thermodesulfobacteriota bacterium]
MRFFPLLDFEHMVLAFFLGIGVLILLYVAWTGYPRRKDEGVHSPDGEGVPPEHHPVAPILKLVYAGVTIWAVAYMIVVGIFGGPVG